MSQWELDLREVVSEQMYLLRKDASHVLPPWSTVPDGAERRRAYRDADRILGFVTVRERCLRSEIERERDNADFWQHRAVSDGLPAAEWERRALTAERELAKVRALVEAVPHVSIAQTPEEEMRRLGPAVVLPFEPRPKADGRTPQEPVSAAADASPVEDGSSIALIDEAVSLFRSIVRTDEPDLATLTAAE